MEDFKAIAFTPNGDYITEGTYKNIDEAWHRIDDWGSRWIFYPIVAVIQDDKIVDACNGFEFMKDKTIKEVATYFRENEGSIADYCNNIF